MFSSEDPPAREMIAPIPEDINRAAKMLKLESEKDAEIRTLRHNIKCAEEDREKYISTIEQLRAALEKYGKHDKLCSVLGGYGYGCNCGLGSALADPTA